MLKEVKIDKLKSHPDNPRVIKDEKYQQLLKSIREFPEMLDIRPIVVNKDMQVIGGNARLKALRELGYTKVTVDIVNLSPEKEAEFLIKDNVSAGDWDFALLHSRQDKDKLLEWGFTPFDFGDLPTFATEAIPVNTDSKAKNKTGYGTFEVTISIETKKRLTELIIKIKEAEGFETSEQALVKLIEYGESHI